MVQRARTICAFIHSFINRRCSLFIRLVVLLFVRTSVWFIASSRWKRELRTVYRSPQMLTLATALVMVIWSYNTRRENNKKKNITICYIYSGLIYNVLSSNSNFSYISHLGITPAHTRAHSTPQLSSFYYNITRTILLHIITIIIIIITIADR